MLTLMKTEDIFKGWRPGDRDWGWLEEENHLYTTQKQRMEDLRDIVLMLGFSFADEYSPIKLGSDARIKNGHHRLVLAMDLKPKTLVVDMDLTRSRTYFPQELPYG